MRARWRTSWFGQATRSRSPPARSTCSFGDTRFRWRAGRRNCCRDTRNSHRLSRRLENQERRTRTWLAALAVLAPGVELLVLHRRRRDRIHAHLEPFLVLMLELHHAVPHGKQRVVRRAAHVGAGVKLGAALAHDDGAGRDEFPAEALHAQILGIRVAPVARGADALLMSHAVLSRPSRRRSSLR